MGLGTKIKEALSSDKNNSNNLQRRKTVTPGAYPESTIDIPRTTSTSARWQASRTNSKKVTTSTKEETSPTSDESVNYTHAPISDKNGKFEEDNVDDLPSPVSTIGGPHEAAFSKENSQHPYWGNIGKNGKKYDGVVDEDTRTPLKPAVTNNATHTRDVSGTITNGAMNDTLLPAHAGNGTTHGAPSDEPLDAPIGTVNRRQPQVVDDDAGRATSMAVSHLYQASEVDSENRANGDGYGINGHGTNGYNTNGYNTNGYNTGPTVSQNTWENNYAVQQPSAANGRGAIPSNGRGTFGTPPHNAERSLSPQLGRPGQAWAKPANGTSHTDHAGPTNDQYPHNYAYNDYGPRNYSGDSYQTGQRYAEHSAREREQFSPMSASENGSGGPVRSVGDDHYGPGHVGAKVLHRCQHCGNDNDITKYFGKGVAYRLS